MVKSEQQRQKKLAKKKSRERASHSAISKQKQQLASLTGQMTAAAAGAVEHCFISAACHDGTGIGSVLIVRRVGGQRALALFLVDLFCLGVKDAMGRYYHVSQLDEIFAQLNERELLESVSPGVARGLVEAAIAYANSLGFSAHPDYRKVAPIWGDIEPEPLPEKYHFGKNGKPFYVNGPNEDTFRQRQIIQTLNQHMGEGNYHIMLGDPNLMHSFNAAPSSFNKLADDNDDEDEMDDENMIEGSVTRRVTSPD